MTTNFNPAWVRLACKYEDAVNAVRRADWDSSVTDEEYEALIVAREAAFAALQAVDCYRVSP